MSEWQVHGHTFDSFGGANDYARHEVTMSVNSRGSTRPIEIRHDGSVVATVSLDALGRVWTDVQGTELI